MSEIEKMKGLKCHKHDVSLLYENKSVFCPVCTEIATEEIKKLFAQPSKSCKCIRCKNIFKTFHLKSKYCLTCRPIATKEKRAKRNEILKAKRALARAVKKCKKK